MDSTLLSSEALDSTLCIVTLVYNYNCNWSVLEKSSRQASFEVLSRCLDLYIPTWISSLHTVNASPDGVVFEIKCQNVLNNCKINALQSPLGCLDASIGYRDMICETHLSVVLPVLFCLGDQQQSLHSLIWRTLLIGEGQGFLPKSICWRW